MDRQTFRLPDLGEGLSEAEVLKWLVGIGDTIVDDQPVIEVETAKASVEIPSPYAGVVVELHGEQGSVIGVGCPLITVDTSTGAAITSVPTVDQHPAGEQRPAVDHHGTEEKAGSGAVLIGYGTTENRSVGRRRARRPGASTPADTRPVSPAVQASKPLVSSPIVRQLARDRKIDLDGIQGTGPHGLITRKDLDAVAQSTPHHIPSAANGAADRVPTTAEASDMTGVSIRERIPLCGIRKAIADKLTASRREIPEATTWVDVDATRLMNLRTEIGTTTGHQPPGLLAFIARFVIAGLARYPELNSRIENQEILHFDGVNLGIAAQTPKGLMVPVIKGAHREAVQTLDTQLRLIGVAAREGTLSAADMSGGTFTLNNYGVFGVDGGVAIINHPEAAILGLGRISPRPWVVDNEIQIRQLTQLSLVFDHRVCDGGTAAGFLRFVADCIEQPTAAVARI